MKKKFWIMAMLVAALVLLLGAAALACPNPDGCPGDLYSLVRGEADGHVIACITCTYQFKESHWGGTATCTQLARCYWEGMEYGELAPHSFTNKASSRLASAATCTEAARYYVQCDNCDAVSDTVTVPVGEPLGHDYSGASATCTTDQVCAREGCGAVLDSAKGHDYSGAPATCTTDQVCARKGCGAVLDSAKGHDYSGAPATCTTDQVCAREGCGAVLDGAKGHVEVTVPGFAPTCTRIGLTAGKRCAVCGEILARQAILPMKWHAYKASTIAPTCTEGGYTKYTCANCGASYTTDETNARGHYYGEWSFGDSAHSALCQRTGCEHTRTVACESFAWRLFAGEAAYDFALCPVCGEVNDGTHLSWVEEAGAEAPAKNLPRGEIVLRVGALANGEAVMSVGFEYSGELTQPAGEVKVTLPAALLEGYTLTLLEADGSESELPFAVEDEEISFTLDFTPVEDEEPVPVRVIRLIPVAG